MNEHDETMRLDARTSMEVIVNGVHGRNVWVGRCEATPKREGFSIEGYTLIRLGGGLTQFVFL